MDVGIGEGGGGEDDEWEEGHESDWVDAVYATTRCYYCQVYGHMARECPAKAKGKGAAKGGGKGATKGATRLCAAMFPPVFSVQPPPLPTPLPFGSGAGFLSRPLLCSTFLVFGRHALCEWFYPGLVEWQCFVTVFHSSALASDMMVFTANPDGPSTRGWSGIFLKIFSARSSTQLQFRSVLLPSWLPPIRTCWPDSHSLFCRATCELPRCLMERPKENRAQRASTTRMCTL